MAENLISNDNVAASAAIALSKLDIPLGFFYRTTTYDVPAANIWYTIGFDTSVFTTKVAKANFTPTFPTSVGETTNNKFTVTDAGIYLIKYRAEFLVTNTAHGNLCSLRLVLNNTSEIAGSFVEGSTGNTLAQEGFTILVNEEIPVTLAAGDYISMQVGTDSGALDIGFYTSGGAQPVNAVTASIRIQRIG